MPKITNEPKIIPELTERRFSWMDLFKGITILILGNILFVLLEPDVLNRTIQNVSYVSTNHFSSNSSFQQIIDSTQKSETTHSLQQLLPSPESATSSVNLPKPTDFGKTIKVPIFYFHYIGYNANPKDTLRTALSITPDNFEKMLIFITQNGYTPITLDTLYDALYGRETLPSKAIVLTFDDGYIDFYVNAYPLLRKYNIKATAFIATGLVDQAPYVHWEQIKEMDQSGLISIEAHSVTHPELTKLSQTQIEWEITQSKQMLENYLNHPVHFFAYPYGLSNTTIQEAVKNANFFAAVGTWNGDTESEGTLFDMPRISDPGSMSVLEFENRLTDMHLK